MAPPGNGQSDFTYYYHPDHLGSTGYVTDASGRLYEHLEYFPFGETWVQEHSNTLRTPYLFTGKEYDQETGLYYFGARYYDPRTSVWQSPDPILGKYLPEKSDQSYNKWLSGVTKGVIPLDVRIYRGATLNLYAYVVSNPLRYIDPNGQIDLSPAPEVAHPILNAVAKLEMPVISWIAKVSATNVDVMPNIEGAASFNSFEIKSMDPKSNQEVSSTAYGISVNISLEKPQHKPKPFNKTDDVSTNKPDKIFGDSSDISPAFKSDSKQDNAVENVVKQHSPQSTESLQ